MEHVDNIIWAIGGVAITILLLFGGLIADLIDTWARSLDHKASLEDGEPPVYEQIPDEDPEDQDQPEVPDPETAVP